MSLLDRRLRASFKLAEDNAHLDDVESSVPSRQVLQDSYELLVRARDQDSIGGASATVSGFAGKWHWPRSCNPLPNGY